MSVEYHLACHKCKERVWICSDGFSGPQLQVWDQKKQAAFIVTHRNCDIKVINEHDEGCDDYNDFTDGTWQDHLRYEA